MGFLARQHTRVIRVPGLESPRGGGEGPRDENEGMPTRSRNDSPRVSESAVPQRQVFWGPCCRPFARDKVGVVRAVQIGSPRFAERGFLELSGDFHENNVLVEIGIAKLKCRSMQICIFVF